MGGLTGDTVPATELLLFLMSLGDLATANECTNTDGVETPKVPCPPSTVPVAPSP